jgi:hypothetical protein
LIGPSSTANVPVNASGTGDPGLGCVPTPSASRTNVAMARMPPGAIHPIRIGEQYRRVEVRSERKYQCGPARFGPCSVLRAIDEGCCSHRMKWKMKRSQAEPDETNEARSERGRDRYSPVPSRSHITIRVSLAANGSPSAACTATRGTGIPVRRLTMHGRGSDSSKR